VLDWLDDHAVTKPTGIAIYGISGGGYLTALAAEADPRIKAWIAATPIYNVGESILYEFSAALKAPGLLLNTFMSLTGKLNESAAINLDKYAWMYGDHDFRHATGMLLDQSQVVDYTRITCPSLFLVAEGEGVELKRQAQEIYRNFMQRGIPVVLRETTAVEGADGHCQVNNLRMAHQVIFDWLDKQFVHASEDVRLIV